MSKFFDSPEVEYMRKYIDNKEAYLKTLAANNNKAAYQKVKEAGWELINIDATLHAERPKMMPHIPKMVSHIAKDLKILGGQVNIKAKTAENLGFVGKEEGIACDVVVLIQKG